MQSREPAPLIATTISSLAVAGRANYGNVGKKEVDECRAGKNVAALQTEPKNSGRDGRTDGGRVFAINFCLAGIKLEGGERGLRGGYAVCTRDRVTEGEERALSRLGQMARGNFAV